jgi:hypothetical protein
MQISKRNLLTFDGQILPQGRAEWEADRYEIMQFSGLKDKNGKEIYEADILGTGEQRATMVFSTDVMQDGTSNCFGSGFFPEADIDPSDCEIIGNIYENPELLKVKQ